MFQVWRSRSGDGRHDGAFQFERLFVRVTRWRVVMAASGLAAYALGLVAFLPAEAVTGSRRDTVGTIWNGQVALDPGFAVGWKARPFTSLISLAGVADTQITGPDTLIRARLDARLTGPVVRTAEGQASLRLLNAAVPALPFTCEGVMRVEADNLAPLGGARGNGLASSGPATCSATGGGPASSVGPLKAKLGSGADGSSVIVSGPDGARLAESTLARNKAVRLTVDPAAQGLLPGVVPMSLDTTL